MFKINRDLLYVKLHYVLINAGVVPILAYGTVFARQAGLSAVTVGLIWTNSLILSVILKVTFSGLADKYEKRRLIFFSSVLLCAFSALSLSTVPPSAVGHRVDLLCHNETFFKSCHEDLDPTTLDKIKGKNANGSVACRFSCDYQDDFAREICQSWRNESECRSDTADETTFDGYIRKKHLFPLGRCVYGTLAETSFADTPTFKYPLPQCRNNFRVGCTIRCDDNTLMTELKVKPDQLWNDLKDLTTWVLFALIVCYLCNVCLNFSLTDTICFAILDDKPHLYGQQRLFGSIGFGLMTLIGGWLTDRFSRDSFVKNYKPLFVTAAVILLIDFLLTFKVKIKQKVRSSSVVKDVSVIFYSVRVSIFAMWCFLMGLFCGQCWQFLFWHLEDMSTVEDLQWIRTLQGLATLSNTLIGEIPVFFVSGWVLKQLGPYNTMSVILFSSAARFFCYSILSRPFWVLPIELLSGFIFSMSYVVIASYSSLIALPGTESTVQAVFSATFEGLGMAAGSLLGGVVYNIHDGYTLFRLMSYVALLAAILHLVVQCKLPSIPERKIYEAKHTTAVYSSPTEAINMLDTTSL